MDDSYHLHSVFSYNNLVHAVSGAAGSVVGLTTFFPLDTLRTRLQVHDGKKAHSVVALVVHILQEEGVIGLYKGWMPVVSSLCCSNFVYFYVYNSLKAVLRKSGKASIAQDLVLGFISGVVNVLMTTPLWVANTRLKLQGTVADPTRHADKPIYTSMVDCLRKIFQNEGLSALWAGTVPSVVLAGNPAVQFMVYEALKRYLQKSLESEELSGLAYFLIGAIAKLVATVVTYPLQLVQTRWRAGNPSTKGRASVMDTIQDIFRRHGWQGLYRGLGTKLTQTVLMAALMFLVYEKIASFIFRLMGISPQIPVSR